MIRNACDDDDGDDDDDDEGDETSHLCLNSNRQLVSAPRNSETRNSETRPKGKPIWIMQDIHGVNSRYIFL